MTQDNRITNIKKSSTIQKGHSVCVSCGKDMPICWDTVCYKCGDTSCYECSTNINNKWYCKNYFKMEKLIKEWEALAKKYSKESRKNYINDLVAERYFAMAEVYDYCADCLRRLKHE